MYLKSTLSIIFILLNSFIFGQSNIDSLSNISSNEEETIEIDSMMQMQYQDTIKSLTSKIEGYWISQGKWENDRLVIDTIIKPILMQEGVFEYDTTLVKDGIIYEIKNGKKELKNFRKLSYFSKFNNEYLNVLFNTNGEFSSSGRLMAFDYPTDNPICRIIYYSKKSRFVLLNMIHNTIVPIVLLNDKELILDYKSKLQYYKYYKHGN